MPEPKQPATPIIPLPANGIGSADWWKGQIQWSKDETAKLLPKWRHSVDAYRDELTPSTPNGIRVNIEFEKTEQKRHQLSYRLPEFKLRAKPRTAREAAAPGPDGTPTRDLKKAIAVFREVISNKVSEKEANLKAASNECLFDLLCPSGFGAVKIGYTRYDGEPIPVPTGAMIPDPNYVPEPQPGAVLGLRATIAPMIPETVLGPNVIAEEYYTSRISPAQLIIQTSFRGSDFNKSDYIGHRFKESVDGAKKKKWPIGTMTGAAPIDGAVQDTDRIVPLNKQGQISPDHLDCVELFYYASRVDPTVTHPNKIRRIVFVEGLKDPVVHQDFKDQEFDERGRFVKGMRTFPIEVVTLRYVSDSPIPPSDCRISTRQGDELSQFRTDQLIYRKKAVPRLAINGSMVVDMTPQMKDKFNKGEHYGDIVVNGNPQGFAVEMAHAQYPSENGVTESKMMGDVNRYWALGSNASSVKENSGTTATEIAAIERATATRLGGERGTVDAWLIRIYEKVGALIQLYADREDFVEIVGESGATAIEAWDRDTVRGEWLFEAVPDSSMPPDAAADRDLALNAYNLLANDPFVNREQLVRQTVDAYGLDPDILVRVPEPPKKEPEPPRVNLSFKGEDLIVGMPQYENVVNVLKALGIPIVVPPPAAPTAQGEDDATGPADVIDRERLRMAVSDNADSRQGGLVRS